MVTFALAPSLALLALAQLAYKHRHAQGGAHRWHKFVLATSMGPTGSMAMVVNQVPNLGVGGVVAVRPCKGLGSSSQQLHGTTTPVMEDCCQSTTTTLHYTALVCMPLGTFAVFAGLHCVPLCSLGWIGCIMLLGLFGGLLCWLMSCYTNDNIGLCIFVLEI